MKGRKSRPTIIKILEGEPNKNRINKREPKPQGIDTTCPRHLTGEARNEWKRIYPELQKMGIMSKIDRVALAAYCQAYSRWVEAEKVIKVKGVLYKTEKGNIITSPMLWVSNKALEQMHKFLIEFGMTPASRSRISIKSGESEDPLDKLLSTSRKN